MQYISGASDDLVELDGDVYEEGTACYDKPTPLTIVLKGGGRVEASIECDRDGDGVWRFTLPQESPLATILPEYGEDNERPADRLEPKHLVGYSEVLIIDGPVLMVIVDDEEFGAR